MELAMTEKAVFDFPRTATGSVWALMLLWLTESWWQTFVAEIAYRPLLPSTSCSWKEANPAAPAAPAAPTRASRLLCAGCTSERSSVLLGVLSVVQCWRLLGCGLFLHSWSAATNADFAKASESLEIRPNK